MSLIEIPTVEEIRREKEGQLVERKSAMCNLLVRLYPEQAAAVAEVVRGEVKSEGGEQL